MPCWEQVSTWRDRVRQAAALTVQAVTLVAAAIPGVLPTDFDLIDPANTGLAHRHV